MIYNANIEEDPILKTPAHTMRFDLKSFAISDGFLYGFPIDAQTFSFACFKAVQFASSPSVWIMLRCINVEHKYLIVTLDGGKFGRREVVVNARLFMRSLLNFRKIFLCLFLFKLLPTFKGNHLKRDYTSTCNEIVVTRNESKVK